MFDLEQEMIDTLKERFPEIFQPIIHIQDDVLKLELIKYVKPSKQTVGDITNIYNKDHEIHMSNVKANHLLNELSVEGEVKIKWEDSKKYIYKVD